MFYIGFGQSRLSLMYSDSGHLDNWTKMSHELMSERVSERASERTSEHSGARERSEQCGAGE